MATRSERIPLSKVDRLTLRNGQMTKGRRLPPVPQLACVGGDGKGLYEIDVMRCKNMGSDYDDDDVSWSCTADVPKYFKLGSTDVICEGYHGPDDPYILKGSCGVEYRLALTDAGYEKYGRSRPGGLSGQTGKVWPYLPHAIFLSVLLYIVYGIFVAARNNNTNGSRRGTGGGGGRPWFGGGGGGGGGGDEPPPPYDPFPPRKPGSASQQQQEQWRPGFWSGVAAGAAGSHLLANNRTREETRRPPPRGYFGDGGGGGGGSSFGESSGSGGSHSTTGFGQTRRR